MNIHMNEFNGVGIYDNYHDILHKIIQFLWIKYEHPRMLFF
jgi:hypothetical protein